MPARKRPLSHPGDNHEDHPMPDSEVVNGDDGDGNGGGGGGSALPFPSSSVQEEEIRRQEEEEEKPQLGTTDVEQQEQKGEERVDDDGALPPQDVKKNDPEADADNGDSSFLSDDAEEEKPEYVLIELADIRREVQCPICLGIIRKTRTVMDCLHRFCRECIDRSMRLGNNECPACRTHCASRRSLRDDPNYDALIAVLYPDIDKYEEEELALRDEELMRNKKIQAYISETFQRQSEALGRRRSSVKSSEAGFMRRSQRNFRSGRGYSRGGGRSSARSATTNGSAVSSAAVSDNEEEVNDGTGTEGNDDPSSETGRQKRCRRWAPARAHPGLERSHDEPEEMTNREMLAWGKNGVRSQTRHGGSGGSSGKANRVDRISRLVDHLHSLDEDDDELDLQLRLIPADDEGKMIPSLERPFLCCRPSLSIKQLAQFIGMQMDMEAEEVEILMEKKLEEQESLGHFQSCFSTPPFDLVLAYRARRQQERERGSSPAGEGPPSSQYEFL